MNVRNVGRKSCVYDNCCVKEDVLKEYLILERRRGRMVQGVPAEKLNKCNLDFSTMDKNRTQEQGSQVRLTGYFQHSPIKHQESH